VEATAELWGISIVARRLSSEGLQQFWRSQQTNSNENLCGRLKRMSLFSPANGIPK